MSGDRDGWPQAGAPMFGLDVMTAMTRSSIEAMEDWNTEVSRFVQERLEKDLELQEEFARCGSPAEFFSVYASFMTRTMRDYAEQATRMQELSLEAASSVQQAAGASFDTMAKRGETKG